MVLIATTGCGGQTIGNDVPSPDDGGHKDATVQFASDATALDGSTAPDVTWDANVVCADGDYYVDVTDDAGTLVLDAGCPPTNIYPVPTATIGDCGEEVLD